MCFNFYIFYFFKFDFFYFTNCFNFKIIIVIFNKYFI